MKDDVKTKDGIQVIARAAAVLRALKDSQTGLSLGQIADRVALPRSTVQRIVAALIDERLLVATRAAHTATAPTATDHVAEAITTLGAEARSTVAEHRARIGVFSKGVRNTPLPSPLR